MSPAVKAVPDGFHTITPSLTCKDAAAAIEFYKNALGATERFRMAGPNGSIMHAELQVGDSIIFLGEECAGMSQAPDPNALPTSSLNLYVEDADSLFNRAVAAGCKVGMPVTAMFWGDRYGKVIDPFGHHWGFATHIEDVSMDEMDRRAAEWMASMAAQNTKASAAGQN